MKNHALTLLLNLKLFCLFNHLFKYHIMNRKLFGGQLNKIIKKYLPDALFLIGVGIASYYLLCPPIEKNLLPKLPSLSHTEYFTEYKVLGIMLIALAIDIVIRRFFANKNK